MVPEVQEFSDASHEVDVDRYVTTWKATNSRNSQIIQFECRFPTFFLSPIVANLVEKQCEYLTLMCFSCQGHHGEGGSVHQHQLQQQRGPGEPRVLPSLHPGVRQWASDISTLKLELTAACDSEYQLDG